MIIEPSAAPLTFETLYSEPSIIGTLPTAASWSADGKSLAFLWNDVGHTFRDIWIWKSDTKTQRRLTHLGAGRTSGEPAGISELAWLSEGRLAFVLQGQLYLALENGTVHPLAIGTPNVSAIAASADCATLAFLSGNALMAIKADTTAQPKTLVAGSTFVGVESFQWAANGNLVFVEADDTNTRKIEIACDSRGEARRDRFVRSFPGDLLTRRRVGIVKAEGGTVTWFDRPDAEDAIWGYGLSQDGNALFISSSDLSIKNHTIFMFDTRNGARSVFYAAHDPAKIRPDWQVAFAPGDKGLIVLTDRDGFNHLHRLPEQGAALEPITSGPWEIAEFVLDASKGKIYFIANEAHPAERHVYSVALTGGAVSRLTGLAGIHVPSFAPDFSVFADLFSDDMTPPELFVQPMEGSDPAQVTHSPLPAFAERRWAEVRYVPFKSHVDGAELMARVMLPHGFEPNGTHPMVVGSVYSDGLLNQWGGRAAHPSWGIDQYLASRGFVVVSPEIRGSFGRGRDWNRAMLNSYGTQDIEDIADCVSTLTGLGYADPKRVGLWGSSYGGLMTLMSLFKKPGFYAAGFAGAPATNVWHAYPEQGWIMGLAEGEDYIERYRAQSALFHSAGLADALTIIHGTKDEVVLYADTMALVEKMIDQGKTFELVTLPGTGHAWAKQSRTLTRFAYGKLAAFFERYLKNSANASSAAEE
ncbi:hypothetical protein ASD83_04705 [Devosia sp. Root685]|uniref:S9 family peptidase n=1 Tax=Devosia sp. Root685 TaxID=1736587 RepID=UPI0006FAFA4A|nr:prolyl oligopeptidase family serine peptidase [Devosia sp. Root685]KRA99804.1 hypothetical protein ASD83_04705 [Devosia sp. Root685]